MVAGLGGFGFGAGDLSRSAIRTSSASEPARILRITCPRWTFTVASVNPISLATASACAAEEARV